MNLKKHHWGNWVYGSAMTVLTITIISNLMGWGDQFQKMVQALLMAVLTALAVFAIMTMSFLAKTLEAITETIRNSKNGKIQIDLRLKDDEDEPWKESLRPDDEDEL